MTDFRDLVDLASSRLGGAVMWANDEYFAEKENMLKPGKPEWREHEYTDRGKWMDGWESRRKRVPGNDQALVRLGVPGVIRGVVVDTAFFRGNHPSHCAIWACDAPSDARVEDVLADEARWVQVLPKSELKGDTQNVFAVSCPWAFAWVHLDIFPDGGVARFRVHGEVVPDWKRIGHARGEVDLAAIEHGGDALACSDTFFGERKNLIMPGRAKNPSDAWETRRRRGPGHDWNILRLGATGTVRRVEIDTSHFKGNHPDTCTLEACHAPDATLEALTGDGVAWRPLLEQTKLQAHTRHLFEAELAALGPVTHVRLCVFPDGGVSRLRVHCELDRDARLALGLRRLDTLPPRSAEAVLRTCCGSARWVRGMLDARPFGTASALMEAAAAQWAATAPEDWHEAFRSHPRIGESKAAAGQTTTEKRWSSQEQSGAAQADAEARAALAEVNRAYEARFGFIYIVCATGRSAGELLDIARERLRNEPDDELRVAAGEQFKITRLRLEKLLEP